MGGVKWALGGGIAKTRAYIGGIPRSERGRVARRDATSDGDHDGDRARDNSGKTMGIQIHFPKIQYSKNGLVSCKQISF